MVVSQLVIMFSTHIRASDGSALKRVIIQLQTPNLANILNFAVKEKMLSSLSGFNQFD